MQRLAADAARVGIPSRRRPSAAAAAAAAAPCLSLLRCVRQPPRPRSARAGRAHASADSGPEFDAGDAAPDLYAAALDAGGGVRPRPDLTAEEALAVQLNALRANDTPVRDHGICLLNEFRDKSPNGAGDHFFGGLGDLSRLHARVNLFERLRRVKTRHRFK